MQEDQTPLPSLALRGSMGGVLMGLANLVPGISGGTMLLAAGVYPRFIQGIAEVTRFRFRLRSILLLGVVGAAAGAAIVLLAGPVKALVEEHRWVMYSIFVGLTLGGVPIVWRLARPVTPALALGLAVGFAGMVAMARTGVGGHGDGGFVILLVAGVAGASAMILPGISGAYLLLVLGQYETILGAIDRLKQGAWAEAARVVVPVGLGVAAGVVGVSNLVGWALRRHEKPTLGVLLGLLLGSVIGIWPFQQPVERGEPRVYFTPTAAQVGAALALVAAGFAVTLLIGRIGRGKG